MAARPVRAGRLAKLDELGEEEVFKLYLQHGSTRAMTETLFTRSPGREDAKEVGHSELYTWLHAAEGRWERWRKAKQMRAHIEADMVYDEAMKADKDNASAQRVKVDALKWRAGVLNREDYGSPSQTTNVTVGVQFGAAWLSALRALEPGKKGE